MIEALLRAGYLYELAGIAYYAFFLVMSRPQRRGRFSRRSQILTLLAAIVLVASVPFGYARFVVGDIVMLALALASLASTWRDAATMSR